MLLVDDVVNIRAFPREQYADPLPFKVAKLSFWPQKMRNVLKRMQELFSDFFYFFRLTKFGSAYISEDSKKMKKMSVHFF